MLQVIKKYKYVNTHVVKGLTYVYFRRGKGKRIRLPNEIGSAEFDEAYKKALACRSVTHVRDMPVTPAERRRQRTEKVLKGAFRSCRTRARQKGVPFDLDLDFLLGMAKEQGFRCALTGIEFFAAEHESGRVDPYTPSIDRKVPALGYVKSNVRIVIYAVNAMLLDWGEDIFFQVANSYRYWSRIKPAHLTPQFLRKRPNGKETP